MKWFWLLLLFVLLARTAHASNPRPVVHLEAGEAAPYSGDLIQPVTLMTLAAEHKKLGMTKRKLADEVKAREIERVLYQEKLDAMTRSLDAERKAKVPTSNVGLFESPVFWGIVGVGVGGLIGYGIGEVVHAWD